MRDDRHYTGYVKTPTDYYYVQVSDNQAKYGYYLVDRFGNKFDGGIGIYDREWSEISETDVPQRVRMGLEWVFKTYVAPPISEIINRIESASNGSTNDVKTYYTLRANNENYGRFNFYTQAFIAACVFRLNDYKVELITVDDEYVDVNAVLPKTMHCEG